MTYELRLLDLTQRSDGGDEEGFAFIEWRIYESGNTIVWRNGNVTDNMRNNPLPCRIRFIF